jgi:excisionase family DNA binding protein
MTAAQAAEYMQRSRKWVLREIKTGRLRGAVVGGRREVLTRREWCDAWVEERAQPVPVLPIHRAWGQR